MMLAIIMIVTAFLLAGCASSPPTRFLTLTPVAPAGNVAGACRYPVAVDTVHLPATLDRDAVVRQTGENTLSINDRNHWGAPLDEMTRKVLAQDLVRRMPAGAVLLPGAPETPSARHLVVTITSFGEVAHRQVRLEGSWTLLAGLPPRPVLAREIHGSVMASDSSYDAQAAAMSRLLADLSDQIATELTLHSS